MYGAHTYTHTHTHTHTHTCKKYSVANLAIAQSLVNGLEEVTAVLVEAENCGKRKIKLNYKLNARKKAGTHTHTHTHTNKHMHIICEFSLP